MPFCNKTHPSYSSEQTYHVLCYKQVTVDQYHSRSSHIFIQRRALQFNIATRGYRKKEKELTRIEILVRELLLLRR